MKGFAFGTVRCRSGVISRLYRKQRAGQGQILVSHVIKTQTLHEAAYLMLFL